MKNQLKNVRTIAAGGLLLALALSLLPGCGEEKKAKPAPGKTKEKPQASATSATNSANLIVQHGLISPLPGAPVLQVSLPGNYQLETDTGNDYSVFYLRDRKIKAGLGIYLGYSPMFHHKNDVYLNVRIEQGAFGDRQVEWRRYENKNAYHSECIIRDPFKNLSQSTNDPVFKLKLHFFVSAPTPEILRELEGSAARLSVKETAKPE